MTVRRFLKTYWNACGLDVLPENILNKQAMKIRINEAATVADALDVDIAEFIQNVIDKCA
ncbi:MAG TPA: hypothetical protein PKC38_00570 [Chitinophagales bacterium]|nr:hypothetical protein [Chitinophagales bacterium]HNC14202.1 hypothetical protein [Cyclobacteriaceae bacterium]